MIGKLHLGAGNRAGLKGRGHLGKRHRKAGPFPRRLQALLGSFEFPAGGAHPRADLTAPAQRACSVAGQVAGHPGKVVMIGPAEAYRPGQRRSGRPGQVAGEVQARLLGGVLVLEGLDGITAFVHVRPQPRGLLAQRIGAVPMVYLDIQQGQARPAGCHANRCRIHAGRKAANHHRLQPWLHAGGAGALHAGTVPEHRHGDDRCVKASVFRHRLSRSAARATVVPHFVPASICPSPALLKERGHLDGAASRRPARDSRPGESRLLVSRLSRWCCGSSGS